ncbi:hypothetical protein ACHAXA_011899 [Cyclostephanos tholiformis]|uniref:Solute carrier family 35 member F6 n=1 Tax=Cyclostephanos tholiformis TaxID=382380 RepID=A0ABD3SCF8_9STRA
MFSRRKNRGDDNNDDVEMTDRDIDIGNTTTTIVNDDDDDDDDDDDVEDESIVIVAIVIIITGGGASSIAASSARSSVVGSIAHTLASTAHDGIVNAVAHWRVLLLGQSVALAMTIAGGTNDVLEIECDISAPGAYNAVSYALVCAFGAMLVRVDMRRGKGGNGNGNGNLGMVADDDDDAEATDDDVHRGGGKEGDGDVGNARDYDHDYDDDVDDVDDDELTFDDDVSPAKRIRILSLGRRRSDIDDIDHDEGRRRRHRRRRLRKAALEARIRQCRTNDRARRGDELRFSRPTYPFLCGLFVIRARWYYYLIVAIIEAQAFYFIFLAFRYTTFTFVYVSDALAIPSAMIFSRLIMKRRYTITHLLGCAICIFGIVVNTASDLDGDDNYDGGGGGRHSFHHVKGDVFAIIGAILLGLDDVLSEIIVNDYGGVNEMLFMKGLFGSSISILQLAIFERDNVRELFGREGGKCEFDWKMVLFTSHFATRAMGVAGEMQFLSMSEAALLNILLLSSDLFAAIFDVMFNGIRLSRYFYVAFACIVIGIVLYEAGPSPAEQNHSVETPMSIEFHSMKKRERQSDVVPLSSTSSTEHAGNLSKDDDAEFT